MNIKCSRKLEDCFDGSLVILYSFETVWTRESIMSLKAMGEIDYYPDFPRPFFRLQCKNGLQVKGVEGDDQCRAVFPREQKEVIQQQFERFFEETFHRCRKEVHCG